MLWAKVSLRESQDGDTGDEKSSRFCGLGIAKILPEVTMTLTASKGYRRETVVSTRKMSEEGQPYHITRLPKDMNSICRVQSQTDSWHPHRHLAPPHNASALVCVNKHVFVVHTAEGWCKFGLGLRKSLDFWVSKPGLEGMLPWEHRSDRQQSSCLLQTCLIQTLHTEFKGTLNAAISAASTAAHSWRYRDIYIYIYYMRIYYYTIYCICCGCSPAALHPETLLCAQRNLSFLFLSEVF